MCRKGDASMSEYYIQSSVLGRRILSKWYQLNGLPECTLSCKAVTVTEAAMLAEAAKAILYGEGKDSFTYRLLSDQAEYQRLMVENEDLTKLVTEKANKIADLSDELKDLKEEYEELRTEVSENREDLDEQAEQLIRLKKGLPGSYYREGEDVVDCALRIVKGLQSQVDDIANIKKIYSDNSDAIIELAKSITDYHSKEGETITQKAARIIVVAKNAFKEKCQEVDGLRKVNEDLLQGVYGPNAEQLKKDVARLKKELEESILHRVSVQRAYDQAVDRARLAESQLDLRTVYVKW
jgi:methyl-accepting chemotaxis protein